jgi:uncharacterized membrane protein (UPF0127 family)
MSRKLITALVLIGALILGGGIGLTLLLIEPPLRDFTTMADGSRTNISLGICRMTVEVVNTDASRVKGLSGRDEIGSDGMLFAFDEKAKHAFWMPDMRFDLDIIFIDGDRVVDIKADVPYPDEGVESADLPKYTPSESANLVLELDAGRAVECGINIGEDIGFVSYTRIGKN